LGFPTGWSFTRHQCSRLSFLDAYSGYNQIKLKKDDGEKTAFITPYSVFCYQVMPFGLKNAGATFQRMMQNCLESQIGRNIQAYINDVVITTRKEESLIDEGMAPRVLIFGLPGFGQGRSPLKECTKPQGPTHRLGVEGKNSL
jgi:hypothetical protein